MERVQGCLQSLFRQVKRAEDEHSVEEIESFDKKKSYLETLREYQLTGDHKTDLDAIKLHRNLKILESSKTYRRKFNKILDALFDKLSLSKKDTDMLRFLIEWIIYQKTMIPER
jgi:hypothetical protein